MPAPLRQSTSETPPAPSPPYRRHPHQHPTVRPSLALSINAVFLNAAIDSLAALLPHESRAQIQLILSGTGTEVFSRLSETVRAQAIRLILAAMTKAFIVPLSAGALTLLLTLSMKWEKLFIRMSAAG